MSGKSIFAEEWRECLREHYKYVIREDPNPRNHDSVTKVLLRPNGEQPPIFTESELERLYLEATLRADEMPDDFVPTLPLSATDSAAAAESSATSHTQAALFGDLASLDAPEATFKPHPLECQCPQCIQINLVPHNDEGQPLQGEALLKHLEATQANAEASGGKKRRKKNKDSEQLSLF